VMAPVTRRALLVGGLAAAAAATGLAAVQTAASRAELVIAYLRRSLPGLAVPDAEMMTFAQRYLSRIDPEDERKTYFDLLFLLLANPALQVAAWPGLREHLKLISRSLTTTFLMSTDFFGRAEQRPERTMFVAYADPYTLGCRNPMARFDG
jgi:hypothetical protein